ncbi:MAG: TIGR01777 family protein [Desulfobulbaceae bacterium]|nr:TIGR01777 family protein [Desulfobulbaceae bacterium]
MKTLITGSSGLVGSSLVEFLFKKGHSIQCLKRNLEADSDKFWATQELPENKATEFDTVIHLAGENVAQGRWTEKKKQSILLSRIEGTKELVDYISILTEKPSVFLCASAVGYYGSRGNEILDENSSLGTGFLADVCRQWEKETQRLSAMGVRVVNLRFGMVLSPRGGALHKMIPPFQARLGGIIGSGQQYISWISIRDLVKIVAFIIRRDHIKGPVNVVSPIQTTNKELTKALGKALNRPTPFKVPAFMAQLIFGQMANEMLLGSSRVTPKILMEAGYEFEDQSLDTVLQYCTQAK